MRARMTLPLLAISLLLGTASAARAQTPSDSGRREETMRSRGWMYMPRFEYRIPRMRLDLDHMRMDALERAQRVRERTFALQDRLRGRRFELENRLRDRQFELRDRLHERMGRLDRARPFMLRRRYRTI